MTPLIPVILCGGAGTRLWPLSREAEPKQFLPLTGGQHSRQLHHRRAEHWIVVKGTAEVVTGDQALTLHENESTYIPAGKKHHLSNRNAEPFEIIEVQSSSHLGEDDIIRF